MGAWWECKNKPSNAVEYREDGGPGRPPPPSRLAWTRPPASDVLGALPLVPIAEPAASSTIELREAMEKTHAMERA